MEYFMTERRSELVRKILEEKIYLKRYGTKTLKGNGQIPQYHIHSSDKELNPEPLRAGNRTANSLAINSAFASKVNLR
jgi:hypothetical protein